MATRQQMAWLKTMVAPAQVTERKYGVLSSVTLAQCILESGWGKSQLARRCNNYFGIKALPGEPYEQFTTREVVSGRSVSELARFAKYPSAIESFEAHARLLAEHYPATMRYAADPRAFCVALAQEGYATESSYSELLYRLIEQLDLVQYDAMPAPDDPAPAKEAA